MSQIGSLSQSVNTPLRRPEVATNFMKLDHHIFTKGEWKKARVLSHPQVAVTISITRPTWIKGKQPTGVAANVNAIADTGAQSDLWSLKEFLASGFNREDLSPVKMNLAAANKSSISIEGAFFAVIKTNTSTPEEQQCRSMIYVSSSVDRMYLSYETMLNLDLLSNTFHDNERANERVSMNLQSVNALRVIGDGCSNPSSDDDGTCGCPQRTSTPAPPTKLPFPCKPENNDRMRAWLLDRYKSSTFNTCPHRPLAWMDGPPIEIHIDENAIPKTYHTAASVPLH